MLKNSFFKLNKNKKFNYKARYSGQKNEHLNYSVVSRIRSARDDFNTSDRGRFWSEERVRNRVKGNRSFNKLFIMILFLLFFIFFYIIDFDFSIFTKH